jgi:alanine racemase
VTVTSWVEVSEERLAGNFRVLTEAAGSKTEVMAVVKANAYGHGAERCSVALARAGAIWFGVADVEEGVRVRTALRDAQFDAAKILVMCGMIREDVPALVAHRLTPVVWTVEQVGWLAGSDVRPHLELDTGMGRQGVRVGAELETVLDAMQAAGIVLDGVMTHLSGADVADGELTLAQWRRAMVARGQIGQRVTRLRGTAEGLRWFHAGSSSSLDNPGRFPGTLTAEAKVIGATRAMVRCGIALYGYCLPIAGGGEGTIRQQLKPVMTWKARVLDVREVTAGETIGYNATFIAPGPMRLALLPVGYSNGLRRELSSTNTKAGGWVMIGGQRAAIVGRISMNLTMVDVTAIEGVRVGDEVVLLGDGVTADDHARIAGTISYEILCGVRAG